MGTKRRATKLTRRARERLSDLVETVGVDEVAARAKLSRNSVRRALKVGQPLRSTTAHKIMAALPNGGQRELPLDSDRYVDAPTLQSTPVAASAAGALAPSTSNGAVMRIKVELELTLDDVLRLGRICPELAGAPDKRASVEAYFAVVIREFLRAQAVAS